jgi:DNA-binding transcriptional regulator YdaS (Cro superfamily)
MELKTWLDAKNGRRMALARHLGVAPSFVQKLLIPKNLGGKDVPFERCRAIEQFTENAVTCEEMRPDLVAEFAYMRTRPTVEASTLAAIEETNPILKAA